MLFRSVPPEGYAKFVKYVGPTVRRDWLAAVADLVLSRLGL